MSTHDNLVATEKAVYYANQDYREKMSIIYSRYLDYSIMNTSKIKYFLISVAIGGTSVLIVAAGSLVIAGLIGNESRNTSNINRPSFEKMKYYGFPIAMTGLSLSIFGAGAIYLTENCLDLKELTEQERIKISPSCIGCRHFHGVRYNGILLTCAMHPSGAENEHCLDYDGAENEHCLDDKKFPSATASSTLVISTTRRLKRFGIADIRPIIPDHHLTRLRIFTTKTQVLKYAKNKIGLSMASHSK
jgi:hypothetical protein